MKSACQCAYCIMMCMSSTEHTCFNTVSFCWSGSESVHAFVQCLCCWSGSASVPQWFRERAAVVERVCCSGLKSLLEWLRELSGVIQRARMHAYSTSLPKWFRERAYCMRTVPVRWSGSEIVHARSASRLTSLAAWGLTTTLASVGARRSLQGTKQGSECQKG